MLNKFKKQFSKKITFLIVIFTIFLLVSFPIAQTPKVQAQSDTVPAIGTITYSDKTNESAVLLGSWDSGDNEDTEMKTYFEWGLSDDYGERTNEIYQGPGSGIVGTTIIGLHSNHPYHFRLVGEVVNQGSYANQTFYGEDVSFVTNQYIGGGGKKPEIITLDTDYISDTAGNLNAHFEDENSGLDTNIYFEYGTSDSFGNITGTNTMSDQSGTTAIYIENLHPDNQYYFRAVGYNDNGITIGNTLIFITYKAGDEGSGRPPSENGRVYVEGSGNIFRQKTYSGGIGDPSSTGAKTVGGIALAIASCAGVGDMIADFISGIGKEAADKVGNELKEKTKTTVEDKVGSELTTPAVPTKEVSSSEISKDTEKNKKENKALNQKEKCLDAIAYEAAHQVLDKLTANTVNWINSGFQGGAFFQNPDNYFSDLAERELNYFINIIGYNNQDYPFGRRLAENLARNVRRGFEQNAKFTLQQAMRDNRSYTDFYTDFSAGGWDAWLMMTQLPQNNPVGFKIITDEELQKRFAGHYESPFNAIRESLRINGGFFNQQKCVDPVDFEELDKNNFTKEDLSYVQKIAYAGSSSEDQKKAAREDIRKHTCLRWETRTPGNMISDGLSNALGSDFKQMELADELNESIAAIMDALIYRVVDEGLSEINL